MSDLTLIAATGIAMVALRLSGFLFPLQRFPARWEEVFDFLPVALLAALVVVTITSASGEVGIRLLAAGGAALAVWKFPRMWVCILVGMGLYILLRLI